MAYGVEFEGEQQDSNVLYMRVKHDKNEAPKLVQKVMQWGWAKTERRANQILISFSLAAIGVSIILFAVAGSIPQPIDGIIPLGQVVPS